MEFFLRYLKDRRKLILILLSFSMVFAVTFAMYQLPLKAVLYPTLLCMVMGTICILFDLINVHKKHSMLRSVQNLTADGMDSFANELTLIDQDYQAILYSLQNEITSLETQTSTRYQEMIEYYTVWVHQIKTPIASMRLTLQNVDTAFSRKLQSELFRIEQYVEMVLTYLRLDATTSDYVIKEHRVDAIVRQTARKFSHEFISRKIALIYETIEKVVITDDKWLGFVLEQVLSNALKYTREGSIHIYLAQNILCIEDTGIGIAPEDLPRVFEKGYTGYNGRTDQKASGIGLYLCKRVCQNLGIGISVESEMGKGTVVKMDLQQYQMRKE